MLKVTKKNSAPLPLWFENAKDMNWLTTRIEVLQQTFNLLNTRKLSNRTSFILEKQNLTCIFVFYIILLIINYVDRVDASELYAIILFMAEGDYTTVI
jgi:hypothetical protein